MRTSSLDKMDEILLQQAELIVELFEINGNHKDAAKQRKYVKKMKQEYENKRRIERENNRTEL
jgi:hypothetical protein